MTTLSIEINDKLAKTVQELARLPEADQERYAQLIRELKLQELRREARKGLDELDRGLGTPLDMEEIKKKARARRQARQGEQT